MFKSKKGYLVRYEKYDRKKVEYFETMEKAGIVVNYLKERKIPYSFESFRMKSPLERVLEIKLKWFGYSICVADVAISILIAVILFIVARKLRGAS